MSRELSFTINDQSDTYFDSGCTPRRIFDKEYVTKEFHDYLKKNNIEMKGYCEAKFYKKTKKWGIDFQIGAGGENYFDLDKVYRLTMAWIMDHFGIEDLEIKVNFSY